MNLTLNPSWIAATPRAVAMCVFPVPDCPTQMMFSLSLSVTHMVVFHVHEGGIRIGFGVTVSSVEYTVAEVIFFLAFIESLEFFREFLQLCLSLSSPIDKLYLFLLSFFVKGGKYHTHVF